jgi:hypothetical protein
MARLLYYWRYGSAPYTYAWLPSSEAAPASDAVIVDRVDEKALKIDQTDKSLGFRTRRGFFKTFTAGANVKSYIDVSFPYAVDLLCCDYKTPSGVSAKNRLWVEIAPNTDMAALVSGAALSAAVASTDTEVVVNAQAKGAIGAFLSRDGFTQTEEVYFRLTSIPSDPTDFTALKQGRWDPANSKLKSHDGSALGLTAASGDKVYLTLRWEDGSYLAKGEFVRIGDETSGSSSLPAGTPLRMMLLNEDASEIDIGFNLVYFHS